MKWIACALGLLTAFAGFAGCSGLFQTLERPRVNIANIAAQDVKLFEQVFDLELRVQDFSIPLRLGTFLKPIKIITLFRIDFEYFYHKNHFW